MCVTYQNLMSQYKLRYEGDDINNSDRSEYTMKD